jgi:FixJ family two-component response regulator
MRAATVAKSVDPIVFVVDDDASMREALASLLGSVSLRVQCFASPVEFLRVHADEAVSCLILDVRMPGLSGLELQRVLARMERQIPIVFISAHGDIPTVVRAMKAGAVEFLPKPFTDEELLDAIREALERDAAARSDRAEVSRVRARHARLTERQRQVLTLVIEGRLNKQIAGQLGLSENTVKIHRRRIMDTMDATSLAGLVHLMARLR